jgi:hypothetical protein
MVSEDAKVKAAMDAMKPMLDLMKSKIYRFATGRYYPVKRKFSPTNPPA